MPTQALAPARETSICFAAKPRQETRQSLRVRIETIDHERATTGRCRRAAAIQRRTFLLRFAGAETIDSRTGQPYKMAPGTSGERVVRIDIGTNRTDQARRSCADYP